MGVDWEETATVSCDECGAFEQITVHRGRFLEAEIRREDIIALDWEIEGTSILCEDCCQPERCDECGCEDCQGECCCDLCGESGCEGECEDDEEDDE